MFNTRAGVKSPQNNCWLRVYDERLLYSTERTHNIINAIHSSRIQFHWLSTEINTTLWHKRTRLCLLYEREQNHYICIKSGMKEKWLTSSREQRLWVRSQNPSRQLKTGPCEECCLMLSAGNEERSMHTLPLCYKQSDNTLVVLHLHLMSVQAARYANVTRMWGVWTIVQPSPSSLGESARRSAVRLPSFCTHFCSQQSEVVGN